MEELRSGHISRSTWFEKLIRIWNSGIFKTFNRARWVLSGMWLERINCSRDLVAKRNPWCMIGNSAISYLCQRRTCVSLCEQKMSWTFSLGRLCVSDDIYNYHLSSWLDRMPNQTSVHEQFTISNLFAILPLSNRIQWTGFSTSLVHHQAKEPRPWRVFEKFSASAGVIRRLLFACMHTKSYCESSSFSFLRTYSSANPYVLLIRKV